MALSDDDPFGLRPRPKPPAHEVGQNLDSLSIDELGERVALLREEITRLEEARDRKSRATSAADAVFRTPGR